MNKIKGFLARAGTKGKIAISSAVALGIAAVPTVTAFADDPNGSTGGVLVVPEEGGVNMWEKISTGVTSFITDVMTPVGAELVKNEVVLAMLSVTFVMFGIRAIGRAVRAFGRGR